MDTDKMRLSGILLVDSTVNVEYWLGMGEWHEVAVLSGNTIMWYSIL